MQKTGFKLRDLKVQLGLFSTSIDSKHVCIVQIVKIGRDFGENQSQKLMMPEVLKSTKTKLLLVMPETNTNAIVLYN